MEEPRSRADADRCFVCGPANPIGLNVSFRLEDDVCLGEFTPDENHVGFDGVTHGGIIYSALDDVMANWLFLRGARGYTARCEVRYRNPLPVGQKIRLEGRLLRKKSKIVVLKGVALRTDNDSVIAECEASFVVTDPGPDGLA